MALPEFKDLLEHFPPDTRIAKPKHLPGVVPIWTTTDDVGGSAVHVVFGDEVSRIAVAS
jgi:hypothetical protein